MSNFRFTAFGAVVAIGLMPPGARVARAADAQDSPGALKVLCTDILAAYKADDQAKAGALVKALALPNHESWFKKAFGDELGAKAAEEYGKMLPSLEPEIGKLFAGLVKGGRTEINGSFSGDRRMQPEKRRAARADCRRYPPTVEQSRPRVKG